MKYMECALDILRRAEEALRTTIAEATSKQEYKQVASIASLADAVTSLVRANALAGTAATSSTPVPERPPAPATSADRQPPVRHQPGPTSVDVHAPQSVEPRSRRTPAKRRSRRAKPRVSDGRESRASRPDGLPRFLREADRLVKIGWSERDHRVYEHRAPRGTVFEFARLAHDKASDTTAFTMDDVLPLKDQAGKESPSYQAYLALAWLRTVGAIQRVGKDGYTAKRENLEREALEHLWNSLDAREAQRILEKSL